MKKNFPLGLLKVFALCIAAFGFGLMVGCESTDTPGDGSSDYDPKPWNSPASWEGGGGLGGFGSQYE